MAFFSLGGAHPSVNLLHAATKVAPALVYILCELVNPGDDAFSVNFVIIVTLLGVGASACSSLRNATCMRLFAVSVSFLRCTLRRVCNGD